jgi:hypothetical protein
VEEKDRQIFPINRYMLVLSGCNDDMGTAALPGNEIFTQELEDEDHPSVKSSRNADHLDSDTKPNKKRRASSEDFGMQQQSYELAFEAQNQLPTRKRAPKQEKGELKAAILLASCGTPAQ